MSATVWHDDDAFWETYGPLMFDARRWENTPTHVTGALGLMNMPENAAVLDLCCGPGRLSLELARRGYRVTGVDRTKTYLDEAQRRADAEGLPIEFVQDDMREFCRPEAFDGAVNLFTSFGYFEDQAEDRRVVENLYRSLKPGGVLVMEMLGREVLARIYRGSHWEEVDGVLYLEEPKITHNWTWIENRRIVIKDGVRRDFSLGHRVYSGAELDAVLRGGGFADVQIYGDLAGAPYDYTATRLVAVAWKK